MRSCYRRARVLLIRLGSVVFGLFYFLLCLGNLLFFGGLDMWLVGLGEAHATHRLVDAMFRFGATTVCWVPLVSGIVVAYLFFLFAARRGMSRYAGFSGLVWLSAVLSFLGRTESFIVRSFIICRDRPAELGRQARIDDILGDYDWWQLPFYKPIAHMLEDGFEFHYFLLHALLWSALITLVIVFVCPCLYVTLLWLVHAARKWRAGKGAAPAPDVAHPESK